MSTTHTDGAGIGPRLHVPLDGEWEFLRGRAPARWLDCAGGPRGEPVRLPHCWNRHDEFREGVAYYRGRGAYRTRFTAPAAADGDWLWLLESEGFYGVAEVRLNGWQEANLDGQYLGFRLDVTDCLRPGESNDLGVALTNRCARHVLPGHRMPDFLLYGGISGRMRLARVPAFRLEEEHTQVLSDGAAAADGELRVRWRVRNDGPAQRSARLHWRLEGEPAAEARPRTVTLAPGESAAGESHIAIRGGLRQWSPEHPVLHRVCGELRDGDAALDAVRVRFGVRTAEFRPGAGFFLNGRRVELRGVNRHESMPGFGRALPDELHLADAHAIRDMGLNFVRLSHYPQHPAFLDACDELGILVYAEIASWKSVRGGRWLRNARRQMRDLVLRDRNRPCVILWGMGNEGRHRRAFAELDGIVREFDPARPTIYAENHLHRARCRRTLGCCDVWGVNYELDRLSAARDAARLRCVVLSECCNRPDTRRGDADAEAEQVEAILEMWRRTEGQEFVAGYALWCFNDYATLRKRRYRRFSGVVDAWRVPKAAAALLAARYAAAPVLKVFGGWGAACGAGERTVRVFSNCERVRLYRGGACVCEVGERPMAVRAVSYAPVPLIARGVWRGREVSDRLEPFGPAVRLAVSVENAPPAVVRGDCAALAVRATDSEGRLVADWSGEATLEVGGPALLRSYTPWGACSVAGGIGRAFVEFTGDPGEVTVRASHPALAPGAASLPVPAGGRDG